MNAPLVHVLVINWNGLEHLDACFRSLVESSYQNMRLILVDNASTDGSVAYVREAFGVDPRVEILECPANLGWSGGNNHALKQSLASDAAYVFLLNNDTAVARDTLEKLVAMAESKPDAGAFAPKMVLFDSPEILNSVGLTCSVLGASWDRGIGRLDGDAWNSPEEVIGVCGGACFLRVAALRKSGLLPEEFEIYMDDLDLCLRIWNAGFSIWTCPEAVVRHKFSATLGSGARARHKYYLNTRNRFWLMMRSFPVSKAPVILPACILGELRAWGSAAREGAWWRIGAHLRAYAAALAYLSKALRERALRRRQRTSACRFWRFVQRSPLFCPGLILPEDGWYPPVPIADDRFRPMGRRAWHTLESARTLRLHHTNCYPALGKTSIAVTLDGNPVATLSTGSRGEVTVQVGAGRLEFLAEKVFRAEDTGEPVDLGGWLHFEAVDSRIKPEPSPHLNTDG